MTEILIYGIVGDSWDGLDANTLVPLISDSDDDLHIRINSPGGYVMEGLAIFNAITRQKKKGRAVTTYIDGLAASMASVLAMAGDEIVMADNALMMIHNPWDCACGDAEELRRTADKLDLIRDQLVGIYAHQSGLDAETLKGLMDVETWMTAVEALAQNFVTTIDEPMTVEASCVQPFGFKKAPENPLISAVAMARGPRAAAAASKTPKETDMPNPANPAAVTTAPANPAPAPANPAPAVTTDTSVTALTTADVQSAVRLERERVGGIRALGKKHGMTEEFVDGLIAGETTLDAAREQILEQLAAAGDAANIGHNSPARVTVDAREKFIEGATNWLLVKAGVANIVEKAAALKGETIRIDPGEFRGVRNTDLAREALSNMGVACNSRDPDMIVRMAMTAQGAIITQTTGDFPVLFENAIHRTLQAAYAVTPDTWSRFCGIGSVSDFRAHNRYLRGSFGVLDSLNEAGEFKNKSIPDLAKESIIAGTKGNIINLSRQAIVNDDMDVLSGLTVDLGRAAKLTIEVDVYAVIVANPNMNDGIPFFHASHNNIATVGAAPTVAAFDGIRVGMASQKDVSDNEFLEIRPAVGLFPIGLGGAARVVNGSQYDPDTANKLQRPNIVNGMFSDIVDTPRLSGTPYYAFADPNVAPAIEVAFLNGVTEPFTDSQDGWRVDGWEAKVRHDYGVAPVNWRSAYKQPGA